MADTLHPDAFRWPLHTIDFEASHLGRLSYPIEIGICIWEGPGHDARTWSTLIGRTEDWVGRGVWNDGSETIHGISRGMLDGAPTPAEALRSANRFMGVGGIAYCDGGSYDAYWLERLSTAAGMLPSFTLGSWHLVGHNMDEDQRIRLHGFRAEDEIRHRAGDDAEDHVRAFCHALRIAEPSFERLAGKQ
jgi:hypothetical protein